MPVCQCSRTFPLNHLTFQQVQPLHIVLQWQNPETFQHPRCRQHANPARLKRRKKCETFQQLVEPEVGVAPLGRMLDGLFRTGYEGRTLRQNLGLVRPANRFA